MRSQRGAVKTWVLVYVLVAAGGIAALVGVGCAIQANACPFTKETKQTSTDGLTLFRGNCAVCHGRGGEGGKNGAPSLIAGRAALLSNDDLYAKISRGKPFAGMPRFSRSLTETQIRAVTAFVLSLRSSGGAASTSPAPSGAAS